ncbi:FAD:protein FMN transferase [Subtercola boreus]|nr:FAD:protein FMN transferase [Subtercola boreus]
MATHVFDTMGTGASIRFAGDLPPAEALTAVETCFAEFDAQFSLYRSDSEISEIARGALTLPLASERFRDLYAEALHWRSLTHDSFSPHRPDRVLDLSGLVKAKAMDAAAAGLSAADVHDWMLNVGGDLLVDGNLEGSPWHVAVVDPDDRCHLLCTFDLDGSRTSLATSGTTERGEHIWRSRATSTYRQVSVVADDIVTADVLATAILAGGRERLDEAVETFGVDVIAVDADGSIVATERMHRAHGFAL